MIVLTPRSCRVCLTQSRQQLSGMPWRALVLEGLQLALQSGWPVGQLPMRTTNWFQL